MKYLLMILLGVFAVGCQCPDKVLTREGMYQNSRTIRSLANQWADKLVVDPATGKDKRDEITPLTPQQYDQFKKADAQFEELYRKDKANDAVPLISTNH